MLSQATNTKPLSIQRAVICLWLSAGLVVLLTVASWVGLQQIPGGVVPTLTNLVTVALLALVALKVGAGRNWARWLFAVGYVLGSFMFVVSLFLAPQLFRSLPVVLQGSGIVQFALQSVALVLLFIGTSRQWFRTQLVEK